MNTLQIMRDLSRFPCRKSTFGVYPLDELPKRIERPCLIIANTAKSTHNGKHWVAFYFEHNSDKAEFFDSFGRPPTQKEFKSFIKNNSKYSEHNQVRMQSDYSILCGQYSLLFLFFRCSGRSFAEFRRQFNAQRPRQNDRKILRMYTNMSRKLARNFKKTQIGGNMCNRITCNQTCTALKKKRRICK